MQKVYIITLFIDKHKPGEEDFALDLNVKESFKTKLNAESRIMTYYEESPSDAQFTISTDGLIEDEEVFAILKKMKDTTTQEHDNVSYIDVQVLFSIY